MRERTVLRRLCGCGRRGPPRRFHSPSSERGWRDRNGRGGIYREDETTRRSPGKGRSRRRSRYTIAPPEHMMLVTHFDAPLPNQSKIAHSKLQVVTPSPQVFGDL